MRQGSSWLIAIGLLVFGAASVFAQLCNTSNGAASCVVTPVDVACPNGTTWCGKAYTGGSTWSKLSGNGFHGYTPGTYSTNPGIDSYDWLKNTFTGLTFNMCNSLTNPTTCYGALHINDGIAPSVSEPWRPPSDVNLTTGVINSDTKLGLHTDQGYFMTTTDTSGSHPITFQFGTATQNQNGTWSCTGCIDKFAVYWGSVDSYNTITLTSASGKQWSFTGSQIGATIGDGPHGTTPNINSWMAYFAIDTTKYYAWQSVSFSSTAAAFEFDNISWETVSAACVTGHTCTGSLVTTPTPEPSGLLLLGSGVIGLGGLLRRRRRS